jgi:AAA-like domain
MSIPAMATHQDFDAESNDVANTEPEFSWMQGKKSADSAVFKYSGQHLSDLELKVLQAAWQGETYDEMAKSYGYSAEYLNKDIGNKLWRKLSDALQEHITKKNFKEALRRAWQPQLDETMNAALSVSLMPTSTLRETPPFPEGLVALDSPFYLARSGVETRCYEAMRKPGGLIRIKAPKLMGKTSLLARILDYATRQNYYTAYLDLGSVDRAILTDLDKFLRWLCLMVGRQLKLKNQLPQYWDTDILGSNDNCTAYFEEYLLKAIAGPLVLGLDDVDRLFPAAEVVEDFFGLLRSWHEKGKIAEIWQNLRLVMAHSTEVYIPLDMHQSPFNAGIPVELIEFGQPQVQQLARLHHLDWPEPYSQQLMQMIGGHPYLVRLAMYEGSIGNTTLPQLLQTAPTEAGIFSNHLRRHLETLQQAPDLAQTFKQVVLSSTPVELNSMQIYQLHSMGLVKRLDNQVTPSCNLYRQYFCRVLGGD